MEPKEGGPFALMPFTTTKAKAEGWLAMGDCQNGGLFNGFRYILDKDPRLALLFDQNGYIAGIQMNVSPASISKSRKYLYAFNYSKMILILIVWIMDPFHSLPDA